MLKERDIQTSAKSATFSGPTMVYRGDWNSLDDYGYQNCVSYRVGYAAGLYIANNYIKQGEACPTLNSKWTKIASFDYDDYLIVTT